MSVVIIGRRLHRQGRGGNIIGRIDHWQGGGFKTQESIALA